MTAKKATMAVKWNSTTSSMQAPLLDELAFDQSPTPPLPMASIACPRPLGQFAKIIGRVGVPALRLSKTLASPARTTSRGRTSSSAPPHLVRSARATDRSVPWETFP